jgi:hypothetical protein
MKRLRKSEIQKKHDHDLLMNVMHKTGYVEYSDRLNPFNCLTEKTRYDRFKRKYERYLITERGNDAWFRDICEVYGTVL